MIIEFKKAFKSFREWYAKDTVAPFLLTAPSHFNTARAVNFIDRFHGLWTDEQFAAFVLTFATKDGGFFLNLDRMGGWVPPNTTLRYRKLFYPQGKLEGGDQPQSFSALKQAQEIYLSVELAGRTFYFGLYAARAELEQGYLFWKTRGDRLESCHARGAVSRYSSHKDLAQELAKAYASLRRLSLKLEERPKRKTKIEQAIEFQFAQQNILSSISAVETLLSKYRQDLLDGNMNAKTIAEVKTSLTDLQEVTNDVHSYFKSFIGVEAGDTAKLVETALKSEK